MRVLKFGGSAVSKPELLDRVRQVIKGENQPCVVVISAFKGVTDRLLNICDLATTTPGLCTSELDQLEAYHSEMVATLLPKNDQESVLPVIKELHSELRNLVTGTMLIRELTPKTRDHIAAFGELISARIITKAIDGAEYIDATRLVLTDSCFGRARVLAEDTMARIRTTLIDPSKLYIVPGFIGANDKGEITTLGRGGSDYTAALLASALDASQLQIWTDVDGFMTADPKLVSKAYAIRKMSYAEAIELSHFGARVIYTPTIKPVYKKNIPISIKNILNPGAEGTLITKDDGALPDQLIKGISSISNINLITLQGTGLVGVPGISRRLFNALAQAGVNVILITQASSEYSITFAVTPSDTKSATEAISAEFESEMKFKKEISLMVEEHLSIVSIVGEQMKNRPGIASNLFRSLSRNGISAIAIAQGSSELNVSVVIANDSLRKALNAIHEGFFLSGYKELNLFLVGTGVVGGALVDQVLKQQSILRDNLKLNLKVCGILNIEGMLLDANGINLNSWQQTLKSTGEPANLDTFVERIAQFNLRNSVFVDCTASAEIASKYLGLLNSFVSVVTPNKVANSSAYNHYIELKKTARSRGVKFMYETNVGAGLPIINTINDLILSGDRVLRIEAVLSGTLNFIFNTISADIPMSKAIRMAKEKGYSEPDPRIDLSGIDVVRKILILCRECGYPFEKEDIVVNTFLPKDCFEGSLEEFWDKVEKYDTDFETRRLALEKQNKRWRFVAVLENDKASVQLMEVDGDHPAYNLAGSNNIILLTTERYRELPMVIKGYGAGAEVTAAGIFADIIRVANV